MAATQKDACHFTWFGSLLQFCYNKLNCIQKGVESMLSVIEGDRKGKLHVINRGKLEAIAEMHSIRQSLQLRFIWRVLFLDCLESSSQVCRREEWVPGNEW